MENKFQTSDFSFLISEIFKPALIGNSNLFSELSEINKHAKQFNDNKDIIKVSGFDYTGEEGKETLTYLFIEIDPNGIDPSDNADAKKWIMGKFNLDADAVCEEYDLDGDLSKIKPIGLCRMFLPSDPKGVFGRLTGRSSHKLVSKLIVGNIVENKIIRCANELGLNVVKAHPHTLDLRTNHLPLGADPADLNSSEGKDKQKEKRQFSHQDIAAIAHPHVTGYIYRRARKAECKIKIKLNIISNEGLHVLKNEGFVKDKVSHDEWVAYQKALLAYLDLLSVYKGVTSDLLGVKKGLKMHLEDYYEELDKDNKQ